MKYAIAFVVVGAISGCKLSKTASDTKTRAEPAGAACPCCWAAAGEPKDLNEALLEENKTKFLAEQAAKATDPAMKQTAQALAEENGKGTPLLEFEASCSCSTPEKLASRKPSPLNVAKGFARNLNNLKKLGAPPEIIMDAATKALGVAIESATLGTPEGRSTSLAVTNGVQMGTTELKTSASTEPVTMGDLMNAAVVEAVNSAIERDAAAPEIENLVKVVVNNSSGNGGGLQFRPTAGRSAGALVEIMKIADPKTIEAMRPLDNITRRTQLVASFAPVINTTRVLELNKVPELMQNIRAVKAIEHK